MMLARPVPSALILLTILSFVSAQSWPYNQPAEVKYFPEHAELARRQAHIQRRLENEVPNTIRKMGIDDGEMFFLEYWGFDDGSIRVDVDSGNGSDLYQTPLLLHWNGNEERDILTLLPG